jgi:cobalamin synthase
MLALANYALAPYVHSEVLSVALITLLLVATGGLHLEGLKNTFAALGSNEPTDNDRAYDSLGVAAIVVVILLKNAAVESMDERLTLSLLVTPTLARWALLTFFYGNHAHFDEASGRLAEQITFMQLLASTAATLALMIYFLGRTGLWIALIVSLAALLIRRLLERHHGVLTHAHSGAVVEVGEALSLILLATL